MRFAWVAVGMVGLLCAACSSSSSVGPEDDSGLGDAAASDAAKKDATTPDDASVDGTSVTDAALTDAAPDTGVTASGSKPPVGSSLCGSGTFTPTDSINACQSSTTWFPPQYTVTKACGGVGFGFSGGVWEAWCTPSSVYIFARFDDAVGFEKDAPTGSFEAGSGSGSANAWFDFSKKRIIIEAPNVQPTAKSGHLYLLHFDGNTDAGTNFRMVGGVALSWK